MAAKLFPWNRYIRVRPGYEASTRGGPIADIESALASDPWSADLTLGLGMAYVRANDPRAGQVVTRFLLIAHNSPIAKRIVIK